MHEVLVNRLFKLTQEKVVRWTDCPHMTIAVDWDVKQQNKESYLISPHCRVLGQYRVVLKAEL